MRFAVVGAGGVGGYVGGMLAHGGAHVTFIARGKTLEALHANGLRVDSIKGDFVIPNAKATVQRARVGEVDVVLLAVKTPQIAEVLKTIGPMLGENTAVVPLENGVAKRLQNLTAR